METTDDTILVAHLELAKEDYLDWLKAQYLGYEAGTRPSSSHNPLSRYLITEIGFPSRIQTDGETAWILLSLTRDDSVHLRLELPEWTVPLAVKYTQQRTQFHGPHPQPTAITISQALDDAGVRGQIDTQAERDRLKEKERRRKGNS